MIRDKPFELFKRVEIDGAGCWKWTGCLGSNGYGRLGPLYVHRLFYELLHGPVPDGLDVEHLCRNRKCCYPGHLEAVTRKENLRRGLRGLLKVSCAKEHPWNVKNIGQYRSGPRKGKRYCAVCHRERQKERQTRKRRL